MTQSALGPAPVPDLLETARAHYRRLASALARLLDGLERGTQDPDRNLTEQLRAHHKALQTVLDIEVQLGRRQTATDAGTAALDLAAARAEIHARLAVWRADRGA